MKVALITGAAQGIGLAIATRLSRDPGAYAIALNDLPSKEEALENAAQNLKCKTLVVTGDVSKEEDVIQIVEKTVKEFGGLDVMIANAGRINLDPIDTLSVDEFDNVLAVNVRSVFLCYKYAGRQMVLQGRGGRLIAASSMAGKRAAPYASAYSASKFAVRGLTQSAAQEYGKYGITVNAYAPGKFEVIVSIVSTPPIYIGLCSGIVQTEMSQSRRITLRSSVDIAVVLLDNDLA
ncbi:hypothetical protein VNI00_012230 [Paramarasmius palmivorus]|uniref:Ketoreductase domain-containing protein n=1 Tax=Paramarasmius palmivorus TaxID=297713 RepID=A0AAW0CA31_9AGAR